MAYMSYNRSGEPVEMVGAAKASENIIQTLGGEKCAL